MNMEQDAQYSNAEKCVAKMSTELAMFRASRMTGAFVPDFIGS